MTLVALCSHQHLPLGRKTGGPSLVVAHAVARDSDGHYATAVRASLIPGLFGGGPAQARWNAELRAGYVLTRQARRTPMAMWTRLQFELDQRVEAEALTVRARAPLLIEAFR